MTACPNSVVASGITAAVGASPMAFNLVNQNASCGNVPLTGSTSSNLAVFTSNFTPGSSTVTLTFIAPGTEHLTLTAAGFSPLVVPVTVTAGVLDLVPAP